MDITTQKLLKVSITLLINCSFYFHACQAVDFIKNGLYVADSLYPPFVYGDFIYYVDTSNYLSKIPANGSKTRPSTLIPRVYSSPFVFNNYVYFQILLNGVKVLAKAKIDGTDLQFSNLWYSQDSSFVYKDNYVYALGSQSYCYKVEVDFNGSGDLQPLCWQKGSSRPFVYKDYVYFQGTNNELWKVKTDRTDSHWLGGLLTLSSPFVYEDYVYFQGPNDELWKVKIDGTDGGRVQPYCKTLSTPFVYLGYIYHRGSLKTQYNH